MAPLQLVPLKRLVTRRPSPALANATPRSVAEMLAEVPSRVPPPPPSDGGSVPEEALPTDESVRLGGTPSGFVDQASLVEMADASGGMGPSLPLVQRGSEPHVWGGPWIRWADKQDPDTTVFVLDDREEAKDCGSVHEGVEVVMHSLSCAMYALCDVMVSAGQV